MCLVYMILFPGLLISRLSKCQICNMYLQPATAAISFAHLTWQASAMCLAVINLQKTQSVLAMPTNWESCFLIQARDRYGTDVSSLKLLPRECLLIQQLLLMPMDLHQVQVWRLRP